MKEINWNLYRIFIEVCKTKSQKEAAKILGVTPSAVNQNLQSLNNQTGVKLLETHARGVEVTDLGASFYKEIEPMFTRLVQLEKNLVELNPECEGLIKIGCAEVSLTAKLVECEQAFRKLFPKIKFEKVCLEGENGIGKLKTKEIDILIGYMGMDSDVDIAKIELGETKAVFVAEKKYAEKQGITSVIAKEKFEALPLIGIRGYIPFKVPEIYVDRMESIFQYVVRGMGIGWFWEDFIDENHPHTPCVKFQVEGIEPTKQKLICAYSTKLINRTALAFIKHVEGAN